MAGMAERQEPGGVGAALKRARESRGIALRQIADTTKLSVTTLEAIERNQVRKLPGGLFARSFVRAYAAELGLDVEQVVVDYFAQFPGVNEAPPPAKVDEPEPSLVEKLPAGSLAFAVFGVPAVALIVWALVVWHRGPDGPPPPLSAERIPVTHDMVGPQPLRPVSDAVPAVGTLADQALGDGAVDPHGALTLRLSARRSCWVSVSADGRPAFSRLFGPGEEQAVRAGRELRVKIGDASAVAMWVNGSPVRPLGGRGEVVTVLIDTSTIDDLLATH